MSTGPLARMTKAERVPTATQTPTRLPVSRGPAGTEPAWGRARFCRKGGFSSWPARPPETCPSPATQRQEALFQQGLAPGAERESRPTPYGAAPALTPGSETSSCSPARPGEEPGWPVPSRGEAQALHPAPHAAGTAPHRPGANGIHAPRCGPGPMAETRLSTKQPGAEIIASW